MFNKIKMILRTNWINTLRFNLHYFGIKGLKFRCLLAHHVKLDKLKGKFIIQDDTRLRLGYWNNFSEEGCHKHLKFYNDGLIQVGGGTINFNKGCTIFVDKGASLIIGDNVNIGTNTALDCFSKIEIGSNTMFSWNCMVMTRDGHHIYERGTKNLINPIKDVIIGEHCWICQHSLILKGAVIPSDTIIAAKSVISKKLEDSHCIYANNKKIKENIDFVL